MKAPTLEQVPGFRLATTAARIKDWKRDDMALVVADGPADAAGVFTQSTTAAAPVRWCRAALRKSHGRVRALLVNAGCANAFTGNQGRADAKRSAELVAAGLADGTKAEETLVFSTGVIGRPLPMDRLAAGIAALVDKKRKYKPGAFAKAILTTDLVPKTAGVREDGFVLAGACKGSGMIAPNMATMLAFLLTDRPATPAVLRTALSCAADQSFNNVTVDGDTSTNDSLVLLSSGRGKGTRLEKASGPAYGRFLDALTGVCVSLAEQIARDGEGATKLIRVRVEDARSDADARRAARSIAESPLVKTAMFGNDPNWGRLVMAIGKSGAKLNEGKIDAQLCGVWMCRAGEPQPFDAAALSKKMKAKEIDLRVSLGAGKCACAMLTCDFSYDYVRINADYTT